MRVHILETTILKPLEINNKFSCEYKIDFFTEKLKETTFVKSVLLGRNFIFYLFYSIRYAVNEFSESVYESVEYGRFVSRSRDFGFSDGLAETIFRNHGKVVAI